MRYNLKFILKMAIPIALSYLAVGLMNVVDALVVGNYNTNALAYIGMANSVFVFLFCIPLALLQGVQIYSSQQYGAKKFKECGKIFKHGRIYAWILSLIFVPFGLCGKYIFTWLGQSEEIVENSANLLSIYTFSIPFILYYANTNYFLQSIKKPYIGTYGFIVGNICNVILNPMLVYGFWFISPMGAEGCALATLIIRMIMALYMHWYMYCFRKNKKAAKHFNLNCKITNWIKESLPLRKIGYGLGLIVLATDGSFSVINVFAGWLGVQKLATFTIITNVNVFVFMIFFAISQATTLVVAHTYGAKTYNKLKSATLAGYIIYLLSALVLFSGLYFFAENIFGVFTNDINIIAIILPLLPIILIDLVVDTAPLNVEASLRGVSDIKYLTITQIISFLLFRLTACYVLAFVYNMSLSGLILGLAGGGIGSALMNIPRLVYIYKKLNKDK